MPANEYRFVTRWQVEGTPDAVFDILDNPLDYVRWWPSVWLRVEMLDRGGSDGTGRTVRVLSRGWLPYKLRWTARTVEAKRPSRRRVLKASGLRPQESGPRAGPV